MMTIPLLSAPGARLNSFAGTITMSLSWDLPGKENVRIVVQLSRFGFKTVTCQCLFIYYFCIKIRPMISLQTKIEAMLWDVQENLRIEIANKILSDPFGTLQNDNQLLLKALNSFTWYELIRLLGDKNLNTLLSDANIKKLFPAQRRNYYNNARRLLSKYSLPASGQSA
jgi:hypothetical protein